MQPAEGASDNWQVQECLCMQAYALEETTTVCRVPPVLYWVRSPHLMQQVVGALASKKNTPK